MNLARHWLPLLLGVLLIAVIAPAPTTGAEPTTRPVTDKELDAALDIASREQLGEDFDGLIQSVASRFPLVTVSTEPGQSVWNRLNLNSRGKKVDGFRFRVPAGEPRDMLWAFISVDLRYEWYILPLSGKTEGFNRNSYYKPQDVLGDRAPAGSKDLVLQSLPASSLKPGDEYLVWIRLRHAKPRATYVAINLLPAAEDPTTIEAPEHIARSLGLSRAGDPIAVIAVDVAPTTQPATQKR
jgi:hypothetical protein